MLEPTDSQMVLDKLRAWGWKKQRTLGDINEMPPSELFNFPSEGVQVLTKVNIRKYRGKDLYFNNVIKVIGKRKEELNKSFDAAADSFEAAKLKEERDA